MSCDFYLGKETDSHLDTTSFHVVVEHDKVSPEPLFLQAKQSQYETNGLMTDSVILEFLVA